MTTLRRFRALPRPPAQSNTFSLLARMRDKAGSDATILTVRAHPQIRIKVAKL